MTRHLGAATIAAALALPVLAGCGGDNPAKPDGASSTTANADRAAIEAIIQAAPELDAGFTDDGGELLGEATSARTVAPGALLAPAAEGDTAATLPVRWGRWRIPPGHPPVRTITFLTPPDSGRALVKVNVKFDGWFLVDRTDDGVRNPGRKPLRDELTCYALFRKIWFHPDSASTDSVYGWRLLAVSPVEFTMINPDRQTVSLSRVEMTGERTHVTVTDPSELMTLRRVGNPIPLFRAGEAVKVEATVGNTDTGYDPATFVFLHVPVVDRAFPGPRDRIRIRMWDDGTHGDVVAADGVFTVLWTVRDLGAHHAAVDVINARTLQNETENDYNSTAWGIPYASYPSFLP